MTFNKENPLNAQINNVIIHDKRLRRLGARNGRSWMVYNKGPDNVTVNIPDEIFLLACGVVKFFYAQPVVKGLPGTNLVVTTFPK